MSESIRFNFKSAAGKDNFPCQKHPYSQLQYSTALTGHDPACCIHVAQTQVCTKGSCNNQSMHWKPTRDLSWHATHVLQHTAPDMSKRRSAAVSCSVISTDGPMGVCPVAIKIAPLVTLPVRQLPAMPLQVHHGPHIAAATASTLARH
jgi:hypothetical protein